MTERMSWAERARAARLLDRERATRERVQAGDALEGLVTATLPFLGAAGTAHPKIEQARRAAHPSALIMNPRFKNLPAETQNQALRLAERFEASGAQLALTHLRALVTDACFGDLGPTYQAELLKELADAPAHRGHAQLLLRLARHPNLHQRAARTQS